MVGTLNEAQTLNYVFAFGIVTFNIHFHLTLRRCSKWSAVGNVLHWNQRVRCNLFVHYCQLYSTAIGSSFLLVKG